MSLPAQSVNSLTSAAVLVQSHLRLGANADGGWGYYGGNASRIEPTCWSLLAQVAGDVHVDVSHHSTFLARCQRNDGWLVDAPGLPVNIAFNAIAAFTWLTIPSLATSEMRQRLITVLTSSKGVQVPDIPSSMQNNRLQGWSWVDQTFSWVEPTAWAIVALRKARATGLGTPAIDARIDEGQRLLVDRCCRDGGWNFGNANMFQQDLRPYVPTTALGLLALRDALAAPAAARSITYLDTHWQEEPSSMAAGLSMIALRACDRPIDRIAARLLEHIPRTMASNQILGLAVAALALSDHQDHVFRS